MSNEHSRTLFSIGHSNHKLEVLLGCLVENQITDLYDSRSVPFSKRYSYFNQKSFSESVAERGIRYRWIGDTCGGRLAPTKQTREKLRQICIWARKKASYRPCLLCSCGDPVGCHRHYFLGQIIAHDKMCQGITIKHLHPTKEIIMQGDTFTKKHRTLLLEAGWELPEQEEDQASLNFTPAELATKEPSPTAP